MKQLIIYTIRKTTSTTVGLIVIFVIEYEQTIVKRKNIVQLLFKNASTSTRKDRLIAQTNKQLTAEYYNRDISILITVSGPSIAGVYFMLFGGNVRYSYKQISVPTYWRRYNDALKSDN